MISENAIPQSAPLGHGVGRRVSRTLGIVAVSCLALLLPACSSPGAAPSDLEVIAQTDGSGGTWVNVGVVDGLRLQPAVLQELSRGAGVDLREVALPEPSADEPTPAPASAVDVVLGVDEEWLAFTDWQVVSTTPYGYDDACLLVDRLWFSANNMAQPEGADDIEPDALQAAVGGADPLWSPYAMVLLPMWVDDWAAWPPQEAQNVKPMGIEIGSSLQPVRGAIPSGESQYKVLSGTCVQRTASAAILSSTSAREEAATRFVEFLKSAGAQELLQTSGLADPTAGDSHPPYTLDEITVGLAKWEKTFTREQRD